MGEQVEELFEAPGHVEPDYTGRVLNEKQIRRGRHRKWIGGHWEKLGALQRDFLLEQALQPHHRFIDVGCGSLRAGRHLIRYLDPGHYYGIDANRSVMQAGYDHELDDHLRTRIPVGNLRATDRFDVDFGVRFHLGIAQSVFTHVSLNHVRLCLYRLAQVMAPGARFFATFNLRRRDFPVDGVVPTKRPKYGERNPYWYYADDMRWAASFAPWEYRYIGNWGHPGGQRMFELTRLPDDEHPRL